MKGSNINYKEFLKCIRCNCNDFTLKLCQYYGNFIFIIR